MVTKAKYQFFKTTPLSGKEGKPATYHVRNTTKQKMTFQELCETVEKQSTISTGDTKGAIDGIVKVMTKSLLDGKAVEIEGLGSFWANPTCDPVTSTDEINAQSVRFGSITFRPCKSLAEKLKRMKFLRDAEYPTRLNYSDNERRERILRYVKNKGYIRNEICRGLNGCSRYMALKDLNHLMKEGKIKRQGTTKNGVYVVK